MLDPHLTDEHVQSVIESMVTADRQSGQHAQFVWDCVTAGQDPGIVTLGGLQNWLWYPKAT
jgi:hypothetical protein